MTERDAQQIVGAMVDRMAFDRLHALSDMIVAENARQNLIARSTVGHLWQRHMLDSVQLLKLARLVWTHWLDIGTGGGFPGLVIACVSPRQVTLVEPRTLRAEFLQRAATKLDLPLVSVSSTRVERVEVRADVISARAVATPAQLFAKAGHCATERTRWILPMGRLGTSDLAAMQHVQPGMVFHVEQSLSSAASSILVADGHPR